MRLEISTQDRVGMTQEILAVFARHRWDISAMEVSQYHVYLQLPNKNIEVSEVASKLNAVSGVEAIKVIELLPGERKSQQLEVLLAKIPEPIIDIDKNGFILTVNLTACDALNMDANEVIGKPLNQFIKQRLRIYLSGQAATQEVTFASKQYYADITPIKSVGANDGAINGAIIVLRSLENVGRHLSHYQTGHSHGFDSIIGTSPAIEELKQQTKRFASLELPVLITGETGTGKELLAQALHDNGNRSGKPFLAINCASLPEHLLESELFGYESGAFTGARSAGKPGLFELADGGTIFLDEIAEMPVYLQAKLLRFLEDYKLRRLGGLNDRKVDIRIISATHQPLAEKVQAKLFREDLYYRLNVLNLQLPSLKHRKEDIPLLAAHFISNAAKQVNLQEVNLSPEALQKIMDYAWPGNVRQLQNILFRVVALAQTDEISAEEVVFDDKAIIDYQNNESNSNDGLNWQQAQQQFEQTLLRNLYPLYPSTRKLAQRLQVSHNKIAMKLRQYDIVDNA